MPVVAKELTMTMTIFPFDECKHCDNQPMKHTDTCLECFHDLNELAQEIDNEKENERTFDG